jgi:hypothetical protein
LECVGPAIERKANPPDQKMDRRVFGAMGYILPEPMAGTILLLDVLLI